MTDKDKRFDELNGPTQISLIFEPVDYAIDFEVKETARSRADRVWKMKEPEQK
jgi:hypothetical protein